MSRRSFEMAEDPDWFAGNYELRVPLHIITDEPPAVTPREGGGVTFTFCRNFAEAFTAAKTAAGKRVAVIGERSAVEEALASRAVDEIYLRVVTAIAGGGERLIDQPVLAGLSFAIKTVDRTENAVHLHLARRDR